MVALTLKISHANYEHRTKTRTGIRVGCSAWLGRIEKLTNNMKYTASLIRLAPMIQTDIDLVREMNSSQRELHRPFDMWPEWAKHDAQLVANYREHCVASALPNTQGQPRPSNSGNLST